jgi:cytochrome P450
MTHVTDLPEIHPTTPEALRDPFTAYGQARERAPLARIQIPGFGPMWALTRYEGARAMLGDARFELNSGSFLRPPGLAEEYLPYLRTMSEMDGPEHARLRRLVAPAFTARRAGEFRSRIEPIVARLLDTLPEHVDGGSVDLLRHVAVPLPMEVICELVGIAESDRPRWRTFGAAVAGGMGADFVNAIPRIVDGTKAAIAAQRTEPGDDLLADLVRIRAEDGDRLSETELVTMVWLLVLAGQTPANLLANGIAALLTHPEQLAALRAEPGLLPHAVDELLRWGGPTLLSGIRYAREDSEVDGGVIPKGEAVVAAIASANHDPRAYRDPGRLDVTRTGAPPHLSFSHGPHFCLGASLARVQSEVAFTEILRRFPKLALAVEPDTLPRAADPGTWRLSALPVTL